MSLSAVEAAHRLDIAVLERPHLLVVAEAHHLPGRARVIEADRVPDFMEECEIEVVDFEIAVITDLPSLLRIEADQGLPDGLDRLEIRRRRSCGGALATRRAQRLGSLAARRFIARPAIGHAGKSPAGGNGLRADYNVGLCRIIDHAEADIGGRRPGVESPGRAAPRQ